MFLLKSRMEWYKTHSPERIKGSGSVRAGRFILEPQQPLYALLAFVEYKMKHEKGFLYIMSNPAYRYIKIGRCDEWPSTRAKTLSRICSSPFDFKVEYAWQTRNNRAAEYEAKQVLERYWVVREFYDVAAETAAKMIEGRIGGLEPFEEEAARWELLRRCGGLDLGPVNLLD